MSFVPKLQDKFLKMPFPKPVKNFMRHPAGFFSIFFWAPTFKWTITLVNIGEMSKPAEKISAHQQIALAFTGALFTRWGLVITPINYNVSLCNFFMSAAAMIQLYRKT